MNRDSVQSSPADTPDFITRLVELGQPRRDRLAKMPPPLLPTATLAPAGRRSLAEINPPPLPEAYLALRRTAENPMSGVADVAAAVSKDPSLVTYVLRLANSPLYAPVGPVETVSRAVNLIGLSEIVHLAAGAMLSRLFEKPPRPELLSLPDFWRHAVAVGMLARNLARRRGEAGCERFFVTGLLHDMGRLVLAVAEPDLVAAVIVRAGDGRISMDAAERLELTFDHAALGGRICDKWRMPVGLIEGVTCHHDPLRCPESVMAAAVHVADFMANALGVRVLPTAGLPRFDYRTLSLFNLTKADPQEFADILDEGLSAMAALFAP